MGLLSGIVKSVTGGDLLSLAGGFLGDKNQSSINTANADLQREFAQNGIRWKVEDARAAGIHPLYALGAQTINPSPSYVGGGNLAHNLSQMGQDVSRSIHQTRTAPDRQQAILNDLTIEKAQLENDVLRQQLNNSKLSLLRQVGPPIPGLNMIDGNGVLVNPSEVTVPDVSNRGIAAGRGRDPANVEMRVYDGGTMLVPGQEYAEALEGMWPFGAIENLARNTLPYYRDKFRSVIRSRLGRARSRSFRGYLSD